MKRSPSSERQAEIEVGSALHVDDQSLPVSQQIIERFTVPKANVSINYMLDGRHWLLPKSEPAGLRRRAPVI
jgi:hypothetical protein